MNQNTRDQPGTSRNGQYYNVRFDDWNVVPDGCYARVVSDPRLNPPRGMNPRLEFNQRVGLNPRIGFDQRFNPQVGFNHQVGCNSTVNFDPRYHPYSFRPEQATVRYLTPFASQQWHRFPTTGTVFNTSTFGSQGRLCYVCSKPGHSKKDCPKRVLPVCYFCNEEGHSYTNCLQRKTWQDSSAGLDEFERLCSIRILENNGVNLTPKSKEFRDFETFVATAFKKYAQRCGAVRVTPPAIPDHSLDIEVLSKEIVHPHSQEYEQHCEGFFLITDKKSSACSYENFVKKCETFDSQKTGHLDFRGPTVFWNQMFRMFREVLQEKKGFPSYVFDKDFSMFPKETTFDWHLTPLNKTFLPFLKEEFRDVHNPKNMMPGINTCQLLLGHAMSFTGWHTENVNLPSINYHHSGKPKYWVVVAEKHGELLKAFFRKSTPSFYEKCRSAELHTGFLVFPQLLKANDPPIPFHCLKQCKGDYIITFPGAFHFVVNSGLNVAQATNFAFPEWLPFAKAREGCSCVYSDSLTAVSSRFNL